MRISVYQNCFFTDPVGQIVHCFGWCTFPFFLDTKLALLLVHGNQPKPMLIYFLH